MDIENLTNKSLRMDMKNGFTLDKFLAKYKCNEDAFVQRLKSILSGEDYSRVIMKLRPKKEGAIPSEELQIEMQKARVYTNRLEEIDSLLADAKEKQDASKLDLAGINSELTRLGMIVADLLTKAEEAKAVLDQSSTEEKNLIEEKERTAELLRKTKERIDNLKKIKIKLSGDGVISFEGSTEEIFDDSERWGNILILLAEKGIGNELKGKELVALAKLMAITKDREDQFIIEIENPLVSEVFEKALV